MQMQSVHKKALILFPPFLEKEIKKAYTPCNPNSVAFSWFDAVTPDLYPYEWVKNQALVEKYVFLQHHITRVLNSLILTLECKEDLKFGKGCSQMQCASMFTPSLIVTL